MADSKISALPASSTPLVGTEVVPLVQSGTTKKVAVSDLTSGRAVPANGVAFPATQVPSADPNTLDDYEEGTWTPAQGAGVTVVGAFSSSGTYTKIGRLVYITGFMQGATSIEVAPASVLTNNLPFQSSVTGPIGRTLTANIYIASDNLPSGYDLYNAGALTPTGYLRFNVTLIV